MKEKRNNVLRIFLEIFSFFVALIIGILPAFFYAKYNNENNYKIEKKNIVLSTKSDDELKNNVEEAYKVTFLTLSQCFIYIFILFILILGGISLSTLLWVVILEKILEDINKTKK